jgi:metal-responsive CopG/Arc/MetJ family transcriptional regulator
MHRCILVYVMARQSDPSDVLTIRVPRELGERLKREARRQRRTRSAVARDLLIEQLSRSRAGDLRTEARRQSLLVRNRKSEREALSLVLDAADLRGWK